MLRCPPGGPALPCPGRRPCGRGGPGSRSSRWRARRRAAVHARACRGGGRGRGRAGRRPRPTSATAGAVHAGQTARTRRVSSTGGGEVALARLVPEQAWRRPERRTARPALLSCGDDRVVQRSRSPRATVAASVGRGRQLENAAPEDPAGGRVAGRCGRARGRRSSAVGAGHPRRRGSGCRRRSRRRRRGRRSSRTARAGPRRRRGRRAPAAPRHPAGPCPPRRGRAGRPCLVAAPSRSVAPGPRFVGSPTSTVVERSGAAASRAAIDRTTSTSTPWSRSTSARAIAPPGPAALRVERLGRTLRGEGEQDEEDESEADDEAVRRGAPGTDAVPTGGGGGIRACGAARGARSSHDHPGGRRLRQDGAGAGQDVLERDDGAGGVRSGRPSAVADRVEGVGGRRRGDPRMPGRPGRARRRPRVRCGRAGRRGGCARRPTGPAPGSLEDGGVGVPRRERGAGGGTVLVGRAGGAVEDALRRGPVIRRSARTDRATTRATTARPRATASPTVHAGNAPPVDGAPQQLAQPVREAFEEAGLLAVDALAQLGLEPLPGLRGRRVERRVEAHRISAPRRRSATERGRPAARRG